jgi:predicted dehydrogenase
MVATRPDTAPLWLVGAGGMARHYARVLSALGSAYAAIGRGAESAASFEKATGRSARPGGLASFLGARPAPARHAIVAVPVKDLAHCTIALIEHGVGRILVEKPAGLNRREIERVDAIAQARGAEVYVAYNRRFHASTQKARELIDADGGATSVEFEFTERSNIAEMPQPPEVKARWFLANSTHVVDLAFFLAGDPVRLTSEVAGTLAWHPTGAVFAGSGRTERGVLFSYRADWSSAGQWGVEVYTAKRRLVLRTLETLKQQERGAPTLEPVALDDALDREYKPGVYRQTAAFLAGERGILCSLGEHHRRLDVYGRMAGYPD